MRRPFAAAVSFVFAAFAGSLIASNPSCPAPSITARVADTVDSVWFQGSRRATRWLAIPQNAVLTLIAVSALMRLVFAGMMGLGIDESYMVSAGRHLQLSYFDHPPLSWWLTWSAVHLFNSETELVVRLPFIVLFGLSTWLMYRIGEILFSARAALWAAVTFNLAPIFGVTTGSWVLPDGPLDCALLGLVLCLVRALSSYDLRWWIGVGVCGGLALLSKYTAVLTIAGIGLYLVTQSTDRRWLFRPEPYMAALIAAALFSPVLIWNAQHEWTSFVFQGSRAAGFRLHPLAPFATLAGEALFLLPWIWLPLTLVFVKALRKGPAKPDEWLLCCIGMVPILTFSLIALWSRDRVLFHWAAPGYLMLFPLLGRAVAARLTRRDWLTRLWLIGNAVVVAGAVLIVASEVRWNWLPEVGEPFALGKDPDLAAVDWTSLRTQLMQRRLLDADTPVVATIRWYDAGKIDYALGGKVPVICLGNDPREYGITEAADKYLGRNVLIVAPRATMTEIEAGFGSMFAHIEALPPLILLHAGQEAMLIPLFLGNNQHRPPPAL
jgi:hypothetical protein